MSRKTVCVVVVMALLVAALGMSLFYVFEDKDLRATKKRIKVYKVIEEEQRLTMEILQHKIVIAQIQAKFTPKDPNGS